jgi:UDP-N-acetyl-D-galactosamine dehydrogenase
MGYNSQVILAGRRINDSMGKYIAENTVKALIKAGKQIKGARTAIMGITFKENCQDVRNSKVIDIISELEEYGIDVKVCDPIAAREEVWQEYRIQLSDMADINDMDAMIFAVAHKEFAELGLDGIGKFYRNLDDSIPVFSANYEYSSDAADEVASAADKAPQSNVLIDVKGIFNKAAARQKEYIYWRL